MTRAWCRQLFGRLQRSPAGQRARRRSRTSVVQCLEMALEERRLLTAVTMTDEEQLLLELVNRARANPNAEAARYGIGLNDGLAAGTITTDPKQPLAPHQALVDAAGDHSEDMLNRDYFAHETPDNPPVTASQRMKAAGYTSGVLYAENISWGGSTSTINQLQYLLNAHEGLFKSAGHRRNIMNPALDELGNGVRFGIFTAPDTSGVSRNFNAIMVTENFGARNVNPFITGVVYSDTNGDNFYSLNEAIRSGTVTATDTTTGAVYSDAIGVSGGYSVSVPAGTYLVASNFRIGSTDYRATRTVVVTTQNVKADFLSASAVPVGLSLTPATATINESGSGSSAILTVTRTGSTSGPLVVSLSTSDTTETSVPSTVTIPNGASSVQFTVTAVNDNVIDGSQTSVITASASGFASQTARLTTTDRTTPTLPASVLSSVVPRPQLSWTGVANAATYEIWISNDSTGQGRYLVQGGLTETSFTPGSDLPIGNYRLWVRGLSATGLSSAWSAPQTVRILTPPVLAGSGAVQPVQDFRLNWSAVPGGVAYDVWIDHLSGKVSQFVRNSHVTDTTLALTNMPLGTYAKWVRAKNSSGQFGNWSARGTFTVSIKPEQLTATADGFTGVPTISWSAVPDAALYDVWINHVSAGNSLALRDTSVAGTSLTLPALPAAGTYRVWVRARDPQGNSYAWSSPLDYEVGRAPRVLTPSGNTQTAAPGFTWTAVTGAARYELWVSTLTAPVGRVIHVTDLTGTSYQAPSALSPGKYRSWIRAFDSQGNSTVWSAAVDFTVVDSTEPPPDAVADTVLVRSELSDAAVRQQAPAAEPQYAEALFADTAWQAAVGLEEFLQPAPAPVPENAGAVDRTALMSAAPQLTPASVTNFEMRRRVRSEADAAGPEQGQRVSVRDPGPMAG